MRITDLIKQLHDIHDKHGDVHVGCTSASPDEGYAYQVDCAMLVEADDNNRPYVDIWVNEDSRPLNN